MIKGTARDTIHGRHTMITEITGLHNVQEDVASDGVEKRNICNWKRLP